ncbi:MAG: hypothetical protein EPO16_03940 [Dehalococcoidia bacterium]|nr:MAG: hypothetical protein EPO16_03940 [Dehalococcoidia bacterium]
MKPMREASAPVPQQIARRCPACGRVSAASDRCLYCWRDIAGVAPLPPDEAASAPKVPASLARSREQKFTLGRILRYASLALVLLLVGWWTYDVFVAKPPRPHVPSSTARSAAPGAWSTQDGDNRGTRATSAPAHIDGVEAWRTTLGSPAATALVTDGRSVIAPLQDGRLVSLDAASGKTLWTANLTLDNPPLSAPAIAGDRIYIAQREGLVLALDAANGKEVWRRAVAESFESSPLVADGVVYVSHEDGLVALDAEDGRTLWDHPLDVVAANVTPVIEGNYLVIATANKAIVFDRTTGEDVYYVSFSRSRPSSVGIRDGDVVAVYGRTATAFETSTRHPWWMKIVNANLGGDALRSFWFRMYIYRMAPRPPVEVTLWHLNSLSRRTMGAAFGEDIVVAAVPDGTATALRDGQQVWSAKTGRLLTTPVMTGDGVLFIEDGRLRLLDAGTGEQRAERNIDGLQWASPTHAATYIATADGDVAALR